MNGLLCANVLGTFHYDHIDSSPKHRMGGLNNEYSFLTVLEAGKSKIQVPGDWCLVRAHFCFIEEAFSSNFTLEN